MNPIPEVDPTRVPLVNGDVDLLMLLAIASLVVIFAMLLWAAREGRERRYLSTATGAKPVTTPPGKAAVGVSHG